MTDALLAKVHSKGFTPGRKDVGPLLSLLGTATDEDAKLVERALVPLGASLVGPIVGSLVAAEPPGRHRLVELLGRLSEHEGAREALLAALADADPRTRKAGARALGKMHDAGNEDALLGALGTESRLEVQRAIVEALGKSGGKQALDALRARTDTDPLLVQMRERAVLMLDRTARRSEGSLDASAKASEPVTVLLRCREGIESILREELGGDAVVVESGLVRTTVSGALSDLARARTWTSVALPLGEAPYEGDVAEAVAARLVDARPRLATWTRGALRFRLSWVGHGPRRAVSFRVAELVARADPSMVNDPSESDWEIEVHDKGGRLRLLAVPKSWEDGRFAYRLGDVPAASHPTLAAAIVFLGGVRDDDIVWDPFVGSGLELVERARRGRYRELWGTDTSAEALKVAKANLDSAKVKGAHLLEKDARHFAPRGVTLVLTNPPMGRRVQSAENLDALLGPFTNNLGVALAPGARFAWITPRPRSTDPWLQSSGFERQERHPVDMGGFVAELQRWRKAR